MGQKSESSAARQFKQRCPSCCDTGTKADQQLLLTKRIAEHPGSNGKAHQGHHGHRVPDWPGAAGKFKHGNHTLAPLRQKPGLELDMHDHFNELVPKTAPGNDSSANSRLDAVRSITLSSRQGNESNGGSKRDEVMLQAVNNSMAMYEGSKSHRVSDAEASRARMLMRNQRREMFKEDMALYNDSPAHALESLATFPKFLPEIHDPTTPRSSGQPQSRSSKFKPPRNVSIRPGTTEFMPDEPGEAPLKPPVQKSAWDLDMLVVEAGDGGFDEFSWALHRRHRARLQRHDRDQLQKNTVPWMPYPAFAEWRPANDLTASQEEMEQVAKDHRREVAARLIQRWFAGCIERRHLRAHMAVVAERERQEMKIRAEIMAKMQEQAAKEMAAWRREQCARKIQRCWRGFVQRRLRAAISIQAAWRGMKGRRIAMEAWHANEFKKWVVSHRNAMATRIQCHVRGWLARLWFFRSQDKQFLAATCIQKTWRGLIGRRIAMDAKNERDRLLRLRNEASGTIARAYQFYILRQAGRVILHMKRLKARRPTPKVQEEAARVIQTWFRRQMLLRWADREFIKVEKAMAAREHRKKMSQSDAYRTKFQAPVTTAGIGYVVVTGPGARTSSGPLGSSSSSSSSRTASNSPTAESQVRSESQRRALIQQARLAQRALEGAASHQHPGLRTEAPIQITGIYHSNSRQSTNNSPQRQRHSPSSMSPFPANSGAGFSLPPIVQVVAAPSPERRLRPVTSARRG